MRIRDVRSDAFRQRDPVITMARCVRGLIFLAVILAIPFTRGVSQVQENGGLPHPIASPSTFPPLSPLINRHPDANRILEDSMQIKENQKLIAQLNLQRQKEMASATEKLVILANDLKARTDTNSKESLSVAELRKVEMIEKLAKSVREKMTATPGN